MTYSPSKISLDQWDRHYDKLQADGLIEPAYGGPLRRHLADGNTRMLSLQYDNSPAALRLWNFLLTERHRLYQSRQEGKKIIGVMKDLGTIPVMAYSLHNVTAFYPDGAWWIPCVMEQNSDLLHLADTLGIDESFCPVRAMLGAFITQSHFPRPDLLICSTGAICDDFSVIAQRLNSLGFPVAWWEIPHRRHPESQDTSIGLPTGFIAALEQIEFVKKELLFVKTLLEQLSGHTMDDDMLRRGIHKANQVRRLLAELRHSVYTAPLCPMPALEMMIAEILAIHFCSDQEETILVLQQLLTKVRERMKKNVGILTRDAVRIFWVNPVADLQVMNLLEDCGGRVCGTEFLFQHALEYIPEEIPPLEALSRMAMADPMVGSSSDRAELIIRQIKSFRAEAVVVSRIPGASHCALEGTVFRDILASRVNLPVLEIEVPSLSDSIQPVLTSRLTALVETVQLRRKTNK